LRDLFDLDAMLRHFGADPAFWPQLIERAATLGLRRPAFYALRYTGALLGTPIAHETIATVSKWGPHVFVLSLMDWCYRRALQPPHASCGDRQTRIARWLLYVRSHWLRMPLHLLIHHIGRKLWQRLVSKDAEQHPAIQ